MTTSSTPDGRRPGSLLIVLAHWFFDDAVLDSVVLPTIADGQREIRDAKGLEARYAARVRAYASFWKLVLLAPWTAHTWPVRRERAMLLAPRTAASNGWLVLAGILAFTSPALTPWTAATIVGGLIFALAIHMWHSRHPVEVATHEEEASRRPEINFSRMPVGGNVGGLIFMTGSLGILALGLPAWRWFFIAAVAGGFLTATVVAAWRTSHPAHGLPQNLIRLR